MENESNADVLESLFDRTSDYIETRVELLKLKGSKKVSELGSEFVSKVILGAMFAMFLMLVNIAVALLIGDLLGKAYWGFFVLGGFYLLIAIIIYGCRDKFLKKPVANSIIDKLNN